MTSRKKWRVAGCVFLLLLIACIYIFIPGEMGVTRRRVIQCNAVGGFRTIGDEGAWKKWWPEGDYRVTGHSYPSVGVTILKDGRAVDGIMTVLTVGAGDSIEVLWENRLEMGWDPITRVRRYGELVRLGSVMDTALSALKGFLQQEENIYGMPLRTVKSKDSVLMVATLRTDAYPTTAAIYGMIRSLRAYISVQGIREINPPMLNVTEDSGRYESRVAIPVDGGFKEAKEYVLERFVPWKVLTGEVRGGVATTERAMEALKLYITDHGLTAMAMPFQSLVTERDGEADTARWVTRVVVPVP